MSRRRLLPVVALGLFLSAGRCNKRPQPKIEAAAPSVPLDGCLKNVLETRRLNAFGDPIGTVYAGGSPLFDERTGRTLPQEDYLRLHHPEAHDSLSAYAIPLIPRGIVVGVTNAASTMSESAAMDDFARERFLVRARALFYARLALLTLGLGILLVPAWKARFHVESSLPIAVYIGMVAYSAANYFFIEHDQLGPALTFTTLCLDVVALVYLVAVSGSLQSPLLPTQLLFTMLFVSLFPRPLAIVPPLLTFPIVAWIQQTGARSPFSSEDLFLLLWYSVINCVVVYVIVYLHTREDIKHREILRLQASLKDLAVIAERTRLAREIHDGLGGSLSSLILQAEYIQGIASDERLRREIGELKMQAEESIEELRRALTLMRDDFDLVRGVEDACRKFEARARLKVSFVRLGRERPVASEAALALFRVLQEGLANVVRHAQATQAVVTLRFDSDGCTLTVQDDGRGFDASQPSPVGHYGLANIVERAQHVGGTARVESAIGQGTVVSLTVPLATASGVGSSSSAAA